MRVTQSFDASTLLSIDPELVEWQMGVFRQPQQLLNALLEQKLTLKLRDLA
jgi:hypothetical protein